VTKSVWKRQANGKTVRRKHARKTPPFVMLPKYMITSDAWRSLSGDAIAAFVELARRYDGTNNGKLHLSAREFAALYPVSYRTAARSIRVLIERGFIEMLRASGFNVKDRKRQAAEYRLTHLYCDATREPPSKAFMKWHPPKDFFTVPPEQHFGATGVTVAKIH
jgi:hypothetical protein